MLYDRLVLRPLRRLYLQGPAYLGFWGGQALADVCARVEAVAFGGEEAHTGATTWAFVVEAPDAGPINTVAAMTTTMLSTGSSMTQNSMRSQAGTTLSVH